MRKQEASFVISCKKHSFFIVKYPFLQENATFHIFCITIYAFFIIILHNICLTYCRFITLTPFFMLKLLTTPTPSAIILNNPDLFRDCE